MISIIIPTFNSERFVPGLLDSIFSSSVKNFEVIIADDCSTDNTVSVAKNYPVKLVRMERNSGPARARNSGAKAAKGDILFFLDADVAVIDGTISEVERYFNNDPHANSVIGVCEKEPLNSGTVPRYMALFEYIHLSGSKSDTVSVFSPRCGAVRKDFFEQIGGYNEKYKGADVEDFELARRINKNGSIALNRNMVVRHQFAGFRQVVKNYFKRAFQWVHLFLKDRRFDNAGPSVPSNGIAAVCAFSSFVSMFFIPFTDIAVYLYVFLVAAYLLVNYKWLVFMRREAGMFFLFKALVLNYIFGIDIMIAVIFALVTYPFKRNWQKIKN